MLLLLRYDTENYQAAEMPGFLEKVAAVHRAHDIPATFFCTGRALEARSGEFRAFWDEVRNDPRFDLQDHSYSHIGLGYTAGRPVPELKADYERSFAFHQQVFGKAPVGISICGTSGKDGPHVAGFDATEKSRAELDMVAGLGAKMINSFISGIDQTRRFTNYKSLEHPEIMGFPSGYSDTEWMYRPNHGDPVAYITGEIKQRAKAGEHMPVMLHDWCAWNHAGNKDLDHVVRIAETARQAGYTLVTHHQCLLNRSLWE